MLERSSVSAHVPKMIGLIKKLANLGQVQDNELSIDLVFQSLPDSYSLFIINFNMNVIKTTDPTVKKNWGTIVPVADSKKKRKPAVELKMPKKAQPNLRWCEEGQSQST